MVTVIVLSVLLYSRISSAESSVAVLPLMSPGSGLAVGDGDFSGEAAGETVVFVEDRD